MKSFGYLLKTSQALTQVYIITFSSRYVRSRGKIKKKSIHFLDTISSLLPNNHTVFWCATCHRLLWHQSPRGIRQSLAIEHWYGVFLVRGHRHLRGVAYILSSFHAPDASKVGEEFFCWEILSFLSGFRAAAIPPDLPFFRNGQFPINLSTVRVLSFELIDDFLRASGKGFVIFWLPPVFQTTVFIKGSTIGVKAWEISWAMTAPIPP